MLIGNNNQKNCSKTLLFMKVKVNCNLHDIEQQQFIQNTSPVFSDEVAFGSRSMMERERQLEDVQPAGG